MRAKEILSEGISAVVYHATSFPAAHKMLQTDSMKGPEISFTRSLGGAYHRGNKLIGIIFQFDGNKINQRYKGKAAGTENFIWDDEDEYDPNDKDTWSHTGKDNGQMEDRVYAKNGIQDVTKYITAALAYAPEEYVRQQMRDEFDEEYETNAKSAEVVIKELKSLGIPIRYVAKESELNKKKSSDPEGFAKVIKYAITGEEEPEGDIEWMATYFDYTNYDDDDDFPEIEKQYKTIEAPDLETAVKIAKTFNHRDLELTTVQDEASGETWEN